MRKSFTVGHMFELTNKTFSQNFDYIIALAGIFITLVTMLTLFIEHLPNPDSIVLPIFAVVLMVISYVKLAVMIHRLIILNEKGLHLLFRWSKVELKFTVFALAIAAIAFGYAWLVINLIGESSSSSHTNTSVLLFYCALIILAYVFSRIALVFPSTAVGHKVSFQYIWSMTSNNKLSIFMLVILVPYFSGKIIDAIPDQTLLLALISSVISVFVVIYEIGLISHCYDELKPAGNIEANQVTPK